VVLRLLAGALFFQNNSRLAYLSGALILTRSKDQNYSALCLTMSSKRFVLDTALGSALGLPSGERVSLRRGAKFFAYDMPKYIVYDTIWGGLAEGLGIREEQPLIAPWEKAEQSEPDESPVGLPLQSNPQK